MAREFIGTFTAVTFATHEPGEERRVHSDLHFGRKVAEELGVPLEIVEVAPSVLPDLLDEVLIYGQDFRDFNVHCGLVNAVLAEHIGAKFQGAEVRPCVLTGDTSNELVADYTPVEYGNTEYYSLPDLEPGRLRRFLISGLDTGDREVGLFARHGVSTIQPYALIAQAYASLPGGFLNDDRAKQTLMRCMLGSRIPSYIYDRPKVRAQVADSNKVGGTMAALLDRGIDSDYLIQRFCELSGFDRQTLKGWIRGGLYRFTGSYPEGREDE
jgi:asparagine synthetase B (glutamine-hydrolysing)